MQLSSCHDRSRSRLYYYLTYYIIYIFKYYNFYIMCLFCVVHYFIMRNVRFCISPSICYCHYSCCNSIAIPVATIAILFQLCCNPIATSKFFTMNSRIWVAIIAIFLLLVCSVFFNICYLKLNNRNFKKVKFNVKEKLQFSCNFPYMNCNFVAIYCNFENPKMGKLQFWPHFPCTSG